MKEVNRSVIVVRAKEPFIFEEELYDWWRDQDAWPQKRNLKTFKEWFDVDFYCTVFDLVEKPLMKFD